MDEPIVAQPFPYPKEMDKGTYAWCACGKSANQPFCDGSHRGTGFSPVITEVVEKRMIAWCGCKQSKNKPFCDGSHNQIS